MTDQKIDPEPPTLAARLSDEVLRRALDAYNYPRYKQDDTGRFQTMSDEERFVSMRAVLVAALTPEPPADGVRFDTESGTWVARHTILTAGRNETEANLALASAVRLTAQTWPYMPPEPVTPPVAAIDCGTFQGTPMPTKKWVPVRERDTCPRCDSPAPHLHPAVQHEGEVGICPHPFHARITPENTPEKRAEVEKMQLPAGDGRGLAVDMLDVDRLRDLAAHLAPHRRTWLRAFCDRLATQITETLSLRESERQARQERDALRAAQATHVPVCTTCGRTMRPCRCPGKLHPRMR